MDESVRFEQRLTFEKHALAYQASLSMVNASAGIIWNTFYSMATVNGILLAIDAAIIANNSLHDILPLAWVISLFGMLICGMWYMITDRNYAYYAYWFNSAREVEDKGLSPEVKVITNGNAFGKGGEIKDAAGTKVLKMRIWGKFARVETLTKIIIAFAGILHLFVIIVTART